MPRPTDLAEREREDARQLRMPAHGREHFPVDRLPRRAMETRQLGDGEVLQLGAGRDDLRQDPERVIVEPENVVAEALQRLQLGRENVIFLVNGGVLGGREVFVPPLDLFP